MVSYAVGPKRIPPVEAKKTRTIEFVKEVIYFEPCFFFPQVLPRSLSTAPVRSLLKPGGPCTVPVILTGWTGILRGSCPVPLKAWRGPGTATVTFTRVDMISEFAVCEGALVLYALCFCMSPTNSEAYDSEVSDDRDFVTLISVRFWIRV